MPLIMFVSSSFNTYVNLPKKKQVLKDNAKQTRYSKPNRILEPKENAIQMTLNLIYSIKIPIKQQISVYRSFYYV